MSARILSTHQSEDTESTIQQFSRARYSIDKARRQCKEFCSYVGTLISSETLHHLYLRGQWDVFDFYVPMLLESWCHAIPCSLRKLRIPFLSISKVPKWMSSLGNLSELELLIFSMGPEDVAILGEMPVLLFLTLSTNHGTNGRILIRGFAGLKYFKLKLLLCGTAVEFQAGAMPKLEHLELGLRVHRMGCLNGVSDFGIRHLLALTKLEVVVDSEIWVHYRKPDGHLTNEEAVSLVKTLIGTLHISPIISTMLKLRDPCMSFEKYIEDLTRFHGTLPKEFSSFEPEEVPGQPENSWRSEQNAFDMSNLRVLDWTDEEEEEEEEEEEVEEE